MMVVHRCGKSVLIISSPDIESVVHCLPGHCTLCSALLESRRFEKAWLQRMGSVVV